MSQWVIRHLLYGFCIREPWEDCKDFDDRCIGCPGLRGSTPKVKTGVKSE